MRRVGFLFFCFFVLGSRIAFSQTLRPHNAPAVVEAAPMPPKPLDRPLHGVVWEPPKDLKAALRELRQMQRMGIEALRTPLIWRDTLFALADSLGLQFFQELPFAQLPAQRLVEHQEFAKKTLIEALNKGRNHASARHYGLAQSCDTSDPVAATYFEALMRTIRDKGAPYTKGYYTTTFTKHDKVASTVDFVLFSALDEEEDPILKAKQWLSNSDNKNIGVIMGMGVSDDERQGYLVDHSPEAQARYLETMMTHFLVHKDPKVQAVFVYRWRDGQQGRFIQDIHGDQKLEYSLVASDNSHRPAMKVMQGFYHDGQKVFAFPAGTKPEEATNWVVIMGWMITILIGFAFVVSFRLQDLLPRYFLAHRSFQDTLQRSRDAQTGTNALLVMAFGLCAGLVCAVIFSMLRPLEPFSYFVTALPEFLRTLVLASLRFPWSFALLSAGFFGMLMLALAMAMYALALYLNQPHISPQKTLMIAVWAQWPLLLLMIGAVVCYTTFGAGAVIPALILVGIWASLNLTAFLQMMFDFAYLVKRPAWLLISSGLGLFAFLGLVYYFFRFPYWEPEWDFLMHLIRETL